MLGDTIKMIIVPRSEGILITMKIWSTSDTHTHKFSDFLSFRKHGISAGPRGAFDTARYQK